jgi:deazaflavin-dependent oxidoreductase (nitroreductase family)
MTGSRRALRWQWRGHRFWWRVSGGRIGATVRGLPVLELVTTGRESGRPRSVLLSYVADPAGFIVAASNAGATAAPAWWRNLQAAPRAVVVVRARRAPVTAEELAGEERETAWASFVGANADYATYAAAAGRPIPLVLLRIEATSSGPPDA